MVDAAGTWDRSSITLTEPEALRVSVEPYTYPSGFNVSCHECYNGSITVQVEHGVAPHTYQWSDGAVTAGRTGLGATSYTLRVTDANSCEESSDQVLLRQPERNDWTMQGNTNSNPATDFIGTADDKDVVFKSNNTERLRLKADGSIQLPSETYSEGPLFLKADGTLSQNGPVYPPLSPDKCRLLLSFPYWETRGNAFEQLCPEEVPVLGTTNLHHLKIITNSTERIIVHGSTGKVGIGCWPVPQSAYRLFVEDGIATRDVLVKLDDWPDYVFKEGYHLMPLDELRAFLKRNGHLPNVPSAATLEAHGGVEVGDMQRRLLRALEEQALYILQLEERIKHLERASQ